MDTETVCCYCSPLRLPTLLQWWWCGYNLTLPLGPQSLNIYYLPSLWQTFTDLCIKMQASRIGAFGLLTLYSVPGIDFLKCLFIYLAALVLVVTHGIFSCDMWSLSWSLWDPVSWSGMEPRPAILGAWSLSHWTTREVPPPASRTVLGLLFLDMMEQQDQSLLLRTRKLKKSCEMMVFYVGQQDSDL